MSPNDQSDYICMFNAAFVDTLVFFEDLNSFKFSSYLIPIANYIDYSSAVFQDIVLARSPYENIPRNHSIAPASFKAKVQMTSFFRKLCPNAL